MKWEFIQSSQKGESHSRCTMCSSDFSIAHSRSYHIKTSNHQRYAETYNCSDQNKNNAMLSWCVFSKLHKLITLSFFPVGHTKFAPDWCLDLLKRTYRRTHVSSLQEIADMVNVTTVKGINIPQLVGNESVEVFVPVYDWVNHLSWYYRRFPGVKSYQHFRVSEDNPGSIAHQENSSSDEQTFDFACSVPSSTLPLIIPPPGIDATRRRYVFEHITEFCKEETKDLVHVCSAPEV